MNLIYLSLLSAFVSSKDQPGKQHLIQDNPNEPARLMTDKQVLELIRSDAKFFDLTDQETFKSRQLRSVTPMPTKVKHSAQVKKTQNKVDIKEITKFLTEYSNFHNRYYESHYGLEASEFLFNQVKEAGKEFGSSFSVHFFNHTWLQPSIVARLKGQENPDEIVVVGAHLDSINHERNVDPMEGRAPGADDDGSGTTSVLESIRSLAKSGFKPKRTVEFQFFAAEEVGLRGSQAIANQYAKEQRNVIGMLQLDMTGYNVNKQVRIITDYTDPEHNQFVRLLIDNYSTFKWFDGKCGYGCSDHASYNKAGFRSSFAFEDISNDKIHTAEDTIDRIDMKNIAEYSKIAISYIIELAN